MWRYRLLESQDMKHDGAFPSGDMTSINSSSGQEGLWNVADSAK
jgi:hypothetical protein